MDARIITVTFNPALDKSTVIDALIREKKLRCEPPILEPGGGGINVARAIVKLGSKATAFFWGGGYGGQLINRLLGEESVPAVMMPIRGETRENLTVYDRNSDCQYRFVMPGPEVSADEFDDNLKRIENSGPADFLIASGSLSPGMPIDAFVKLGKIARNMGAKYIVDTSGEALAQTVKEGVYLIKPSMNELASLAGLQKISSEDVVPVASAILQDGKCENIIVSMGGAGAVLITAAEAVSIVPPDVNVKSTVGAGDSMVAGIVLRLSMGKSLVEAFRYGVACGTAATLNAGTSLCKKDDADRIYRGLVEAVQYATNTSL